MVRKPKPRKRQPQRAATQRDQDDAKKAVASPDYLSSPRRREWQEAETERVRLLKSLPHWGQERIRLLGEMLRKTAPPRPQEPAPQQRRRKPGGGNKQKLTEKEIVLGKETYRSMLDKNPTWAKDQAGSAKRLIEKLKLDASFWTVKRWIVAPVLKERRAK